MCVRVSGGGPFLFGILSSVRDFSVWCPVHARERVEKGAPPRMCAPRYRNENNETVSFERRARVLEKGRTFVAFYRLLIQRRKSRAKVAPRDLLLFGPSTMICRSYVRRSRVRCLGLSESGRRTSRFFVRPKTIKSLSQWQRTRPNLVRRQQLRARYKYAKCKTVIVPDRPLCVRISNREEYYYYKRLSVLDLR